MSVVSAAKTRGGETSYEIGVSKVRFVELLRASLGSLGQRPVRTALSALGVTIGIAAMVAVLGLSESSRADLQAQISNLGTNLLTVQAGSGFGAGDGTLPA